MMEDFNWWQFLFGFILGWILIIFVFPSFFTRVAERCNRFGRWSAIKTISAYRTLSTIRLNDFFKKLFFSLFGSSVFSKFFKIASKKSTRSKKNKRENTTKDKIFHNNRLSGKKNKVKGD